MVDEAIALSENRILKRLAVLEIETGVEDPEDDDHFTTLPEQLAILSDRIDNITNPIIQKHVPDIEPRTSLEYKATEFAIFLRDTVIKTGQPFISPNKIMHFLKEELSEPLRMKDIQNPRQFKRDVLQKAKSMFPFVFIDKQKHGRRGVRVVYKPENDYMRLNRTDPYIRSNTT